MNHLIDQIKNHPDYHDAGMILCHEGIVRKTSRDGKTVTGLRVHVHHQKLQETLDFYKKRNGIIDILFEINDKVDLNIGDTIMRLVVAGNIRENVISTLTDCLNTIKSTVTHKTEYYETNA
ncbi:MAG: molybdenum cofactor biosynthesis protein MoaE [Candidatus Magnetomorum sp.]|nr:molybdenum cofactor biosynthesis protein MoaE [Candidatus Magnetomorum sp.]